MRIAPAVRRRWEAHRNYPARAGGCQKALPPLEQAELRQVADNGGDFGHQQSRIRNLQLKRLRVESRHR